MPNPESGSRFHDKEREPQSDPDVIACTDQKLLQSLALQLSHLPLPTLAERVELAVICHLMVLGSASYDDVWRILLKFHNMNPSTKDIVMDEEDERLIPLIQDRETVWAYLAHKFAGGPKPVPPSTGQGLPQWASDLLAQLGVGMRAHHVDPHRLAAALPQKIRAAIEGRPPRRSWPATGVTTQG